MIYNGISYRPFSWEVRKQSLQVSEWHLVLSQSSGWETLFSVREAPQQKPREPDASPEAPEPRDREGALNVCTGKTTASHSWVTERVNKEPPGTSGEERAQAHAACVNASQQGWSHLGVPQKASSVWRKTAMAKAPVEKSTTCLSPIHSCWCHCPLILTLWEVQTVLEILRRESSQRFTITQDWDCHSQVQDNT